MQDESINVTLQHAATHATRCNTLQHAATHCNTLQHTATHCNTLQHTATRCNTLQHTATHCNTLQHTATHCNTLQHIATQAQLMSQLIMQDESITVTLQHAATTRCNTLQHTATHTATHCNTLQHRHSSCRNKSCKMRASPPWSPPTLGVGRLQCVAVCCRLWQHFAVLCTTVQCVVNVAVFCSVL